MSSFNEEQSGGTVLPVDRHVRLMLCHRSGLVNFHCILGYLAACLQPKQPNIGTQKWVMPVYFSVDLLLP